MLSGTDLSLFRVMLLLIGFYRKGASEMLNDHKLIGLPTKAGSPGSAVASCKSEMQN